MKRSILLTLCLLILLATCALASGAAFGEAPYTDEEKEAGLPIFLIALENGGEIRGALYPDIAPESVGNFVELANSGYYDGLIFHRVIPGFMIQGGSPEGTGIGGPGWNIKGEFKTNGVQNELKHTYGVLSMARTNAAYDTAGSQFFIMTADAPHLDGDYAAFGEVTSGMEHVEAIVNTPRDGNNKPLDDQVIKSIRVETFDTSYPFTKIQ